jgi:hypothetical protein
MTTSRLATTRPGLQRNSEYSGEPLPELLSRLVGGRQARNPEPELHLLLSRYASDSSLDAARE